MAEGWTPSLCVTEAGGRCRLSLAGVSWGDGDTLQEAADDLVARLLTVSMCFRSTGWTLGSALGHPDWRALGFLWEIGEIAARGEDIRDRVFGAAGDYV